MTRKKKSLDVKIVVVLSTGSLPVEQGKEAKAEH